MTLSASRVHWGAGGRMIVDGVSLEARTGRILGLIGPNGSGKSSLLRLLARLRKAASGVVTLDDRDIFKIDAAGFARRVALVEQQASTSTHVNVGDVVRLGRIPHRGHLSAWSQADDDAVSAALRRVGMSGRVGQRWQTLSGGERQRVHIARALAQTPSELLLDEPTNHLDIQHQLELLLLIRQLGVTCIIALHDLNLAAMFCDEIAVLDEGKMVVSGPPSAVLTRDLILRVFKVEATITPPLDRRPLRINFDVDLGRPLNEPE